MGETDALENYCTLRAFHYREIATDPLFSMTDFLEPLFQKLPFRLGSSSASTVIPCALDDQLSETLNAAIEGLARLIRRRREGTLSSVPSAALSASNPPGEPFLGPARYSLKSFDEPRVRQAIAFAMRASPLLDATLMGLWINTCGGSQLLQALSALFAKTFSEDIRAQASTPLLHLAWTVFSAGVENAKEIAKPYVSPTLPWEKLERFVGLGVFALARSAMEPVLNALQTHHFAFDTTHYRHTLLAVLTPLAFISIQRDALQDDINPWSTVTGISSDIERLWFSILEGARSPLHASKRLAEELKATTALFEKARQSGAVARMRDLIFAWMDANRDADEFIMAPLSQCLVSDGAIFHTLSSPKKLEASLKRHVDMRHLSPDALQTSHNLLAALRRGFEGDDLPDTVASAFLCWAMDRVTSHTLLKARRLIRDARTSSQSVEDLTQAWLSGRLYRLSADRQATLCTLSVQEEGQLFIDMKGFTQRTYRAKEIVMADFLRTEFYEPILEAAALCGGASRGQKRIELQNLPGDAAIFSGEISALLSLATEIWRICNTYGDKLKKRISQGANGIQQRRQDADKLLKAKLAALQSQADAISRRIAQNASLPDSEKERLIAERFQKHVATLEAQVLGQKSSGDAENLRFTTRAKETLMQQESEVWQKLGSLSGQERKNYLNTLINASDLAQLDDLRLQAEEARTTATVSLKAIEAEERDMSLEAGLFISFGAAAEIASVQSGVFGQVQVAIAEKINEASRGTARDSQVKALFDELLERERELRHDRSLSCPFRVLLAPDFCLKTPPALGISLGNALRKRSSSEAMQAAQNLGQLTLQELARGMGLGDGKNPEFLGIQNRIYNTGEALSGEALKAWLSATSTTRRWFRKSIHVSSLDADIRTKFFFPSKVLTLVISTPFGGKPNDAAIFRWAGRIQFRGFEAKPPTEVYELLRKDDVLFRLLTERHLVAWMSEEEGTQPAAEMI